MPYHKNKTHDCGEAKLQHDLTWKQPTLGSRWGPKIIDLTTCSPGLHHEQESQGQEDPRKGVHEAAARNPLDPEGGSTPQPSMLHSPASKKLGKVTPDAWLPHVWL